MEKLNYEEISSFNLIESLRSGKVVYVLDKQKNTVSMVNTMTAENFVLLTKDIDYSSPTKDRYYLWTINKEETNEQTL